MRSLAISSHGIARSGGSLMTNLRLRFALSDHLLPWVTSATTISLNSVKGISNWWKFYEIYKNLLLADGLLEEAEGIVKEEPASWRSCCFSFCSWICLSGCTVSMERSGSDSFTSMLILLNRLKKDLKNTSSIHLGSSLSNFAEEENPLRLSCRRWSSGYYTDKCFWEHYLNDFYFYIRMTFALRSNDANWQAPSSASFQMLESSEPQINSLFLRQQLSCPGVTDTSVRTHHPLFASQIRYVFFYYLFFLVWAKY